MLKHLPGKLLFCLHNDTSELVINLWREFQTVYSMITDKQNEPFDAESVFSIIHSFMTHFLEIGKKKREGYQPNNVTPYLHVLLYHVPYFVDKYGSLSKFTGQGVEKTNDIVKQIHQSKSNKLDATSDALLTRKRLELGYLSQLSRQKRKYVKNDNDFWAVRKSCQAAAKKARIQEEMKQADELYRPQIPSQNEPNIENLSVDELKELYFKRTGKRTRFRKKEKIIDALKELQ